MNMQFRFEYAASVKSSIREAIVGSVFKFANLSDGFSIHQNANKNIVESNWIIFSHYELKQHL